MADVSDLKLLIDDTEVDLVANRLRVRSLRNEYGTGRELVFRETGKAHFHPTYQPGKSVELQVDLGSGFLSRFTGRIASRNLVGESGKEEIEYRCNGLLGIVEREVIARHVTRGIELVVFNTPLEDPNHEAALANLQVGQMIKKLLDEHADDLRTLNAAPAAPTVPYVQAELDLLTAVPAETITMLNFGLASAIEDLLELEDRVLFWIDASTKVWHFKHANTLTEATLTLVDPDDLVVADEIEESTENAFTAWTIRGREQVEVKTFSLVDGTLEKVWDTSLEATWTIEDAWVEGKSFEAAPIAFGSTFVKAANASPDGPPWTSDEWLDGSVVLIDDSGSVVETAMRNVSGNSVNQINWAWPHPLSTIKTFRVHKNERPASWYVWRRFRPTNPDDRALIERLDPPVWAPGAAGIGGDGVGFIVRPVMFIEYALPVLIKGLPVPITIDSETGEIFAAFPLVQVGTKPSDLHSAGSFAEPLNVTVIAGVVSDPLTARSPSSGWTGTAFSKFGIQREHVEHIPRWRDPANQSIFEDLASKKLGPFKDVTRRGRVTLAGFVDEFQGLERLLNIDTNFAYDGKGTTTGLEDAKMLVSAVEYTFSDEGGSFQVTTQLTIDDDRRPFRGGQNVLAFLDRVIRSFEINTSFNSLEVFEVQTIFGLGQQKRLTPSVFKSTFTKLGPGRRRRR